MGRAVLCISSALALCASFGTGLLLNQGAPNKAEAQEEDRIVALQPVLDKLSNLDPKTFALLNGMLSQATGDAAGKKVPKQQRPSSFLQYLREHPDDAETTLEKLGPILDKLRGLDPKAFGALSNVVSQAASAASKGEGHPALIQKTTKDSTTPSAQAAAEDSDVARKLEALAPVLGKLKDLDGKTFGVLNGLVAQAEEQANVQKEDRQAH